MARVAGEDLPCRRFGYAHQGHDLLHLREESRGQRIFLLEAVAAGVPIVATCVRGVSEMLADDRHALLVRSGDIDALSAAMASTLRDPVLRLRLAAAAKADVVPSYSAEAEALMVS